MKPRDTVGMQPELSAALKLALLALEESRAERAQHRKILTAYETIGDAPPDFVVAAEETAGRHVVVSRRLIAAIHGFYGEQRFGIIAAAAATATATAPEGGAS